MVHEHDFYEEINELRMLVLQECEDGKFRQIVLNPQQFKRISDASIAERPDFQPAELRDGIELVGININQGWEIDADLFIGLTSIDE